MSNYIFYKMKLQKLNFIVGNYFDKILSFGWKGDPLIIIYDFVHTKKI